MATTYRQLTLVQRYQIEALLDASFSQRFIADLVGCHRSTVSREIRRCPRSPYRAVAAHRASQTRRRTARKATKQTTQNMTLLRRFLEKGLSPEMIANRYRLERKHAVASTATFYRWIKADHAADGDLYKHLLRAHRPYRRRYGRCNWRSRYENRRSIEERPAAAENRTRRGDWEGDTMYGKQGHLVTLVDRKSRLLLARKVRERTKHLTTQSVVSMLKDQPCHSLTLDNGVEFSDYDKIETRADVPVFFAAPFASWQRGSNENANGRLRRYLPRKTDLSKVSPQKLRRILEQMNMQPRKCLGWKTPFEVHYDVSVALIV